MFLAKADKTWELVSLCIGLILVIVVILFAVLMQKITDKENKDTDKQSSIESSDIEIDWGYIVDKKDYVSEDKGEVYLLTFEQIIGDKKYQRTDRVTQSTYDKFTIGDKYYRARYTEDGIKTFEERSKKDDSLHSNN